MTYFLSEDHAAARERLRSAHSAMADVELCADLLAGICAVAKLDPMDLPRLYAFSEDARVPRIMTFGKFKGRPVSEVDRGYMNWYARQADTDPYVIEAFRRNGF
jgi:exodeoxyribonuclease X